MENGLTEQLLDWVRNRYFGKYRGVVTDNNDATYRGRIKVRVPSVLGDLETWAMPCVPYAGNGVGSYTIPEPGAGVWIEFEAGDPSYPIWTGCFWSDNERPKNEKGTEAVPSLKIIRSEKGLMITLDDDEQVITLSDGDGSNIMTIDVQSGQITIKGTIKVVVEAPQIELVENAMHPIVFGDNLLQYLNQIVSMYQSHIHPGQLAGIIPVTPAPPVPPFPPATPQLLSMKVKSG
ncbi:MAG: phage baseplate assembly protein V [Candidatus Poribacteria bacterium]